MVRGVRASASVHCPLCLGFRTVDMTMVFIKLLSVAHAPFFDSLLREFTE